MCPGDVLFNGPIISMAIYYSVALARKYVYVATTSSSLCYAYFHENHSPFFIHSLAFLANSICVIPCQTHCELQHFWGAGGSDTQCVSLLGGILNPHFSRPINKRIMNHNSIASKLIVGNP